MVDRAPTAAATTCTAAKSSTAVDATSRTASSTLIRGGHRCQSVRSLIPATRCTSTPGCRATRRNTSMATCTGAVSSCPRHPGPWAARSAQQPWRAAGAAYSTAARARCCQVNGPVWSTYTPSWTGTSSRCRTHRRRSWGSWPSSSACERPTTPACSSSSPSSTGDREATQGGCRPLASPATAQSPACGRRSSAALNPHRLTVPGGAARPSSCRRGRRRGWAASRPRGRGRTSTSR